MDSPPLCPPLCMHPSSCPRLIPLFPPLPGAAATDNALAASQAGCDALCAPTRELNRLWPPYLQDPGAAVRQCRQLTEQTRRGAQAALVGGVLSFPTLLMEPFGETSFLQLCGAAAEHAFSLKGADASFIVCQGLRSLGQARAALLGARQTGLPVYVILELGPDGSVLLESDTLASLITLQGMGAAAVGFGGALSVLQQQLRRVAPYANVPLIAQLAPQACGTVSLAHAAAQVLYAGAAMLAAGEGCRPHHLRALSEAYVHPDPDAFEDASCMPPLPRQSHTITAACAYDTFVLEEDFEFSSPVRCEMDLTDIILEAERDAQDALLVRIDSDDDAHMFSLSAHMARLPVAFLSGNAEALEMALALYCGRAIISSQCDLPRTTLENLAKAYGATVI